MRYFQCGQCENCGAAVNMPDGAWGSILPPQPIYTCMCFPRKMSTGKWAMEEISTQNNSSWDRIDKFFKENKDIQPYLKEVERKLIEDQCYSMPIIYISTIEKLLDVINDYKENNE